MSDPYSDPGWLEYADRVMNDVVPKMEQSAITVSLVPKGRTDIKFALELGMSIMLDKPIIAVVSPGAKVPAKLVTVADTIVEGDLDDPNFGARVSAAIRDVMEDRQ